MSDKPANDSVNELYQNTDDSAAASVSDTSGDFVSQQINAMSQRNLTEDNSFVEEEASSIQNQESSDEKSNSEPLIEPIQPSSGLVGAELVKDDPLDEVYQKKEISVEDAKGLGAGDNSETEDLDSLAKLGAIKDSLLQMLLKSKKISLEEAQEVQFGHIKTGTPVLELLKEKTTVSESDLLMLHAKSAGIEEVDLATTAVSPQALNFIPKSVAERFNVLPMEYDVPTNRLKVAMADPMDLEAIEFLEKKTRASIKPFAANKDDLAKIITERYDVGLSSEVTQVLKDSDLGQKKADTLVEAQQVAQADIIRDAPISKIVSYILDYAIKMRASDVHIEPQEERTRIRYRIDGILQEKLVLPKKVHDALVSRIKISSDLKIDEKRMPQDGRFNYKNSEKEVDLRVSTLPTVHGEKIVMRLLQKSEGAATFGELGFRGKALKIIEEAIDKPNGIILITGPTGSGKTTTLYSILTRLNSPKVNIMTLEDPVEYQIAGVNQVQINVQVGLTFASGLRSFLRQDPNIIMVGEIRDTETANLAVQASLTGHLVLSTLHTNSAAGALPRLLDMGVETFLLSSTLVAVVAQRVVRKICEHCKVEKPADESSLLHLKNVLGDLMPQGEIKLYEGEKCAECNNTGYQGRVGIYELLPVTDKISKMILERKSANLIEDQAKDDGMLTMFQDGFLKVTEGITTIEEVLRVANA